MASSTPFIDNTRYGWRSLKFSQQHGKSLSDFVTVMSSQHIEVRITKSIDSDKNGRGSKRFQKLFETISNTLNCHMTGNHIMPVGTVSRDMVRIHNQRLLIRVGPTNLYFGNSSKKKKKLVFW